jgi:hypothetical protein
MSTIEGASTEGGEVDIQGYDNSGWNRHWQTLKN